MNIDDTIKKLILVLGDVASKLEIDPEFWAPGNPLWQSTNNHVMLMLRQYYWDNEPDDEFKKSFGVVLDKIVWLFVSDAEWRARLGWVFWFVNLYILDKQVQAEMECKFVPEFWNDPRKWTLTQKAKLNVEITIDKNKPEDSREVKIDDSAGGLATQTSH
jgi:hypothetical protein